MAFPLTSTHRLYLGALDNALNAETTRDFDVARSLMADLIDQMRIDARVVDIRSTRLCGACGHWFRRRPGRGRPRKFCEQCSPPRIRTRAAV